MKEMLWTQARTAGSGASLLWVSTEYTGVSTLHFPLLYLRFFLIPLLISHGLLRTTYSCYPLTLFLPISHCYCYPLNTLNTWFNSVLPYLLFAQTATMATISYTMSWVNPGLHLAAKENTFLSFVSDVPFRLILCTPYWYLCSLYT